MSRDIEYDSEGFISVPYPLGVNRAFPLDSRSFFSNIDDARRAVRNAVFLERQIEYDEDEVTKDTLVLPTESEGGLDSEYYFGEPIVVCEGDGSTSTLYVVVKVVDEYGIHGDLMSVCEGLNSEYLRKDEAADYIYQYIHEHLNAECIDDYLFTGAVDECGHPIPSTGLYAFGLMEEDGVLKKCDETPKKVLSFDPSTPYDKNTNPLATMNTVRHALSGKVDKKPGYGLSQNDLTDCLMEKLLNMPSISVEGDKLTINGKSYKLQEWYEIFDYYVGWLTLNRKDYFYELSKDELLDAVKNSGNVPPEGKLYGKDTACGYNTFFVMKRKNINIDGSIRGEYSEWESNGLTSPIRTNLPSVMQHNDVMIHDMQYDVYGIHTYYPNPSDKVQIAFNVNLFDYYVGWMYIEDRNDFYTTTKDTLIAHAEFGNFDGEYYVYEQDYLDNNLFYVMLKDGVGFDEPVTIDGTEDSSTLTSLELVSPIRTDVLSVMEHDTVLIDGATYRVYGLHSYYPNRSDKVHIVFSK